MSKQIEGFKTTSSSKGYEVFIYWEKRFIFPNLKEATKFIRKANNLLFRELFKINELLIDIYPDCRRIMLFSQPLQRNTILSKIHEIEQLIDYCFFPKGDKGFQVINKIEKTYFEFKALNTLLKLTYQKQGNTPYKYKSDLYNEQLEISYQQFIDFKFIQLDNIIKNHECKIIKLNGTNN